MSFENGVEAWTITPGVASLLPTSYVKLMGWCYGSISKCRYNNLQ
jgi:hypothetical protein